jgi:hypothetical protein
MKIVAINLPYCALTIGHKDKYIEIAVNNFLIYKLRLTLIGRTTLIKLLLS